MYKKKHHKKHHKKFPSLPDKDVASPPNQIQLPVARILGAPTAAPLTIDIPRYMDRNDGVHPREQIEKIFTNHYLTSPQISALFYTMDTDMSGDVSDQEWIAFFEEFITPFQTCDVTKNGSILVADMTTCLTTDTTLAPLKAIAALPATMTKLTQFLDRKTDFTLYDYVFLRRVANAIVNCGDQGVIPPQKLFCATAITSPRTNHLSSPQEKDIYLASIILNQGFYYGQVNYLEPLEFVAVAQIWNYFGDYELPYADGLINSADFVRAVQDGSLPHAYNAMITQRLYENMEEMNFFNFAQTIYAYRLYVRSDTAPAKEGNADLISMTYPQYAAAVAEFPTRLKYLITSSEVPTLELIEKASTNQWNLARNREDSFLRNYNNLIFLQMEKKKKHHKKSNKSHKKGVTAEILNNNKKLVYETGDKIFFNMMNNQTNNFADLVAFLRFYRFASLFLELDNMVQQRMTYETLSKVRKPKSLQSLSKEDKFLYDQLMDYLAQRQDFFINFKEFMEWFMLSSVFKLLRNAANKFHSGMDRMLAGFQLLGLRLSEHNLSVSVTRFDAQTNDNMVNFRKAFLIAFTEEIQANRYLFNQQLNKSMVLGP